MTARIADDWMEDLDLENPEVEDEATACRRLAADVIMGAMCEAAGLVFVCNGQCGAKGQKIRVAQQQQAVRWLLSPFQGQHSFIFFCSMAGVDPHAVISSCCRADTFKWIIEHQSSTGKGKVNDKRIREGVDYFKSRLIREIMEGNCPYARPDSKQTKVESVYDRYCQRFGRDDSPNQGADISLG